MATTLYQIVNSRGRVVNGVWNGKSPMTKDVARKRIALMHAQGRGSYRLRAIKPVYILKAKHEKRYRTRTGVWTDYACLAERFTDCRRMNAVAHRASYFMGEIVAVRVRS